MFNLQAEGCYPSGTVRDLILLVLNSVLIRLLGQGAVGEDMFYKRLMGIRLPLTLLASRSQVALLSMRIFLERFSSKNTSLLL